MAVHRSKFVCIFLVLIALARGQVTQEKLDAFQDWLDQIDRVHYPGLKLGFRPDGSVGVFAEEDIGLPDEQNGRRIATIPSTAFVTTALIAKQFPNIDLSALESIEQFAFWLVQGRSNPNFDKGFKTYVDILPSHLNSPVFFNEGELGLLKDSPVYGKVLELRASFEKSYQVAKTLTPSLASLSYETWSWALATAHARVCHLKDEAERPFLALVPFFDSFGHRYYKDPVWGYSQSEKFLDVSIREDFSEGEEVVISYGVYCNWEFFLFRGFVPEYNPDNCYPGTQADLLVKPDQSDSARRQALLTEAEIDLSGLMLLSGSYSKEFELIARIHTVSSRDEAEIKRIQAGRPPAGLNAARVYDWLAAYAQSKLNAAPLRLNDANKLLQLGQLPAVQGVLSERARLALLFRVTELELLHDVVDLLTEAAEAIRNPSKIVEV